MAKQFIKRLITLNVIFVSIMMLYRIMFISYYSNWFSLLRSLIDLCKAFILGIRYDLAILAYMNLFVIICFIIFWFIGNQKFFIKFIKSLKYYYTIFFGCVLFFLCIDFVFYFYFSLHINYLLFELFNHKISYLLYISKNEHLFLIILSLMFILFLVFVFYISKYILEKNIDSKLYEGIYKKFLISVSLLFVALIVSLNTSNIGANKISFFSNTRNNYFFTNMIISDTFFDMYEVLKENILKRNWIEYFGYKNNIRRAFADFLDKQEFEIPKENPKISMFRYTNYNDRIEEIKPNVILIVAESFGTDLLYYNSEQFNVMGELKKHFDEDIVFYNCLYSFESITTISVDNILMGFIELPKSSDMMHRYNITYFNYNYFSFVTNLYRKNKYYAYNLSYNYLKLSKNLFDYVETCGKDDQLIYDEIFNVLGTNDKQKFIFCTTITNHHPFDVPENYEMFSLKIPDRIRNLNLEYKHLLSYQYSCQKMGEFLTRLKKSKYADNTIVAIVGDHRERLTEFDDNIISYKSVPFYLYVPNKLKPAKEKINTTRIVSHFDIIPTLYELSLSSVPYYAIGTSVFDENYQNAISSNYSDAMIINGNDMCTYDINLGKINSYKLKRQNDKSVQYEKAETTDKHNKMVEQYKAAIVISQYLMKEAKKQN